MRYLYIIACFLLSVFVSKEVIADVRLIHAEQKEICDNCESRSSEKSAEERGFEQEQKLLGISPSLPLPLVSTLFDKVVYKAPYIPAIELGIVVPPPKTT
ncbi:hypothetical protein [Niabella hibiscisoli]|uniref:hypothetical protein n=1 Tax=Niabella hibiscisoli TaxID=1825928 RepID=UPI001F0E454C|nr:hypothetical protein [Niabella hibiscisoli]MCH5720645.1 hypothetical protein [Niabella hibiscisoli]